LAKQPRAIILSGGPSSVYAEGAPRLDPALLEAGVPVLGLCYGFQSMAAALDGTVAPTGAREYGATRLESIEGASQLLSGQHLVQKGCMSLGASVTAAPTGVEVVAASSASPVAAFENVEKRLYGVQWHPRSATQTAARRCWRTSSTAARASNRPGPPATSSRSRSSGSVPRSARAPRSAASPAVWTPPWPPRSCSAPSATASPACT